MIEGSPLFCVLSQESLVDLCNVIVFLVDIFCHVVLPLVTYSTSSFFMCLQWKVTKIIFV
jgi:hypothetical protein